MVYCDVGSAASEQDGQAIPGIFMQPNVKKKREKLFLSPAEAGERGGAEDNLVLCHFPP